MTQTDEYRHRFAIGDIHGCGRSLNVLLKHMSLGENDLVVVLGDSIDRGPDSKGVLKLLLEIRETCDLVFILGNHEEMMLESIKSRNFDSWLRHGGLETLQSYGGDVQKIPDEHLDFLRSAVRYWEGPQEICVHANLEPGVELHRQRSSWLRWHKLNGMEYPHPSGKRVVCGHSGVSNEAPLVRNGWVCLDTLAYSGGYLSALNLDTGEILQTSEAGKLRMGVFLDELES